MDTSKVSSKWQVVIPRHVRETEQIRVGSEVVFERTVEGILAPGRGRKAHCAAGGLWHPQDTASGGSRAQGAQAPDIAMIGIDTNIVLRYLLKDDPVLSPRALEIIAANDNVQKGRRLTL